MRYVHLSFAFLLVAGMCLFNSCSTCSRQQNADDVTIDIVDLAIDSSYLRMAKEVFYSLPTPIEISIVIKNMGISYQPSLLNPPGNAGKYLTHRKMAINFGSYVTDLTYTGLFEQTQTMLLYKNSIQQLAEGLGILPAIDSNVMQRLEDNINNRDEMLRIVSEIYASCTSYLTEDDRYFLTLSMLVGGWVEGMYIATSLTNENHALTEDRMKQLVIDQKLTFDLIWQALLEVKHIPDVAALIVDMTPLAAVLDEVGVEQDVNAVSYNEAEKIATITSTLVDNVTPELYARIKSELQTLRLNFTKF